MAGRRRWLRSAAPLHEAIFLFRMEKQKLFRFTPKEATEQTIRNSILHLNNGRCWNIFHEGNLTYQTAGIRANTPDTFVENFR